MGWLVFCSGWHWLPLATTWGCLCGAPFSHYQRSLVDLIRICEPAFITTSCIDTWDLFRRIKQNFLSKRSFHVSVWDRNCLSVHCFLQAFSMSMSLFFFFFFFWRRGGFVLEWTELEEVVLQIQSPRLNAGFRQTLGFFYCFSPMASKPRLIFLFYFWLLLFSQLALVQVVKTECDFFAQIKVQVNLSSLL